ncbi:hypothetical protein PoB_004305200 [Plakobranchus ocellatus]|uniref:Uncharacterized protein n=1 Tax=Plakobranchus ocellatus TaxID=259542 RepID=A0AAV4BC68_9GAST|nr:hypothetical protein PoB_004305200 [Plakobranchus ocellatus]
MTCSQHTAESFLSHAFRVCVLRFLTREKNLGALMVECPTNSPLNLVSQGFQFEPASTPLTWKIPKSLRSSSCGWTTYKRIKKQNKNLSSCSDCESLLKFEGSDNEVNPL